ncbi:MAG TPA: Wzz/FepE/Etk N-terminal domain-containing protein [Thermoleophilia bacterium]|nr:Wzz/FepE/Etk N-terminal domain-containing protein [Thermoleophilia bacterium]
MDAHELPADQLETIELGDYLRVIRERKWIIIAAVAVVAAAALMFSLLSTPKYRASSQLLYKVSNLDVTLFGSRVFEVRDLNRELQTGAGMVRLNTVADAVAQELSSGYTTEQLLGMVDVRPDAQTNFIDITATSVHPAEAADIADAFAQKFVDSRRVADRAVVAEARKLVNEEIASLTPLEAASERGLMLRDKLQELEILESMQTGGYEIVQLATVPISPFSPQPVRNGILGLAVGLVLGLGLAFLLEYLDRRIKDDDVMAHEYGVPVLARVPMVGKKWVHSSGARSAAPIGFMSAESAILESFRTLRSNLHYFEVDRPLHTLMITSALPQEGKTVTSVNLGLSLALSGSKVIILETDLRRPQLQNYLQIGNDVGISNVLAGSHTFAEAMQLVRVDDFIPAESRRSGPGNGGSSGSLMQKNLYCITSGPLPPNPAELLASAKMAELLTVAAEAADYVIVDTPPLLLVSDGLAISNLVDGVILTSRMRNSTVDQAREVRQVLARVSARTIGVVATGVPRTKGYYSRYGGYAGYGY